MSTEWSGGSCDKSPCSNWISRSTSACVRRAIPGKAKLLGPEASKCRRKPRLQSLPGTGRTGWVPAYDGVRFLRRRGACRRLLAGTQRAMRRGSMIARVSCRVCRSRASHRRARAAGYHGVEGSHLTCAREQSRGASKQVSKGDRMDVASSRHLDARMMARLHDTTGSAAVMRDAHLHCPRRHQESCPQESGHGLPDAV